MAQQSQCLAFQILILLVNTVEKASPTPPHTSWEKDRIYTFLYYIYDHITLKYLKYNSYSKIASVSKPM